MNAKLLLAFAMASWTCGPERQQPVAAPTQAVHADPAPRATPSDPQPTESPGDARSTTRADAAATTAPESFCAREYDRMDTCIPDRLREIMPARVDYVRKCEAETARLRAAAAYDEAWQASAEQCLALDECDAFEACMAKIGASGSLEDKPRSAQ
ncbi:MAG: hypothetical protein AAF721_26575 [Myxococcota bacterium]